MPEPSVTIIASTVAVARPILGIVPPTLRTRVVLVGESPEDPAALPAHEVIVLGGIEYSSAPDRLGPTLDPYVRHGIILLDSSQPSRDLAGWAAIRLDATIVWAVDGLRPVPEAGVEFDRIVLGGSHRLVHTVEGPGPTFALVRAAGTKPGMVGSPTVSRVQAAASSSRTRILEREARVEGAVALPAASIVVSVGRGIGGPQNLPVFRELAERLGAALGASRVVVDSGWLPFANQVGQTGAAVAPDLYLAFGISGAIQHLAGMRASRRIVAVNTDPDAPIARTADVFIQADAVATAKAFLERLRQRTT